MWWFIACLIASTGLMVWALPPVIPGPNALDVVVGGNCGGRFSCKPTSQCSVWYAEFNALPPEPCSDVGVVGLCCPDIVLVKGT